MTFRDKLRWFWRGALLGFDPTKWPNAIRYIGRPHLNPDLQRLVRRYGGKP